EYALAWGQQRGLPGAGVSADVLHRHAELAERHVALLQRYHVPTVRAPLYVWLADDHAREGPLPVSWGRYSLGAVGVEGVPGDHYSMLRPPHVAILAARIRRVLDLESARGPRREPHAARCVGARGVASE